MVFRLVACLGSIHGVMSECWQDAEDRTFVVHTWLTLLIARRYHSEVYVDPPVTSRIFQELSDGHVRYFFSARVCMLQTRALDVEDATK